MSGAGRSKPDFSGDYVLNRGASTLSPAGAANVESSRVRIEHQEPRFRSEFVYVFNNGQRFDGAFELTTDAREVTGVERGQSIVSSLSWEGDAIVFTTRGNGTMTFRYELIGDRLRMSERLRGTDHDQDNVWIFDRLASSV
jgi:hypothetical protein